MAFIQTSKRLKCADAFDLREGHGGLGPGGNALRVRPRERLSDAHALARGEERPRKPIEFVRDEGRIACDLVGTTHGRPVLVSDQFVSVLKENGFTGWETFPARLFHTDGSEIEGYHGLAVTGRAGPIDDSLSEEIIIPPPVPQGRARRGLRGACFQPETWDGSDVFVTGGSSAITVTEPVKRVLEKACLTNIRFKRRSEIERTWRADGSLIK
jgi:hypothetical protein